MSIRAAAQHPLTDVQAIEEMATAVLASIAHIHADGLTAVATIADNPPQIRVPLAEAEPPAEAELPAEVETPTEVEPPAEAELPAEVETPAEVEFEPEPVQLIRAAPPLPSRGRHLAEALTDQLPAQHVA